ncbi:MAG: segregation/condensation protein A [Acidobacteria bacterium]|nr:segregation/condensation protein A [Acidobacteriota bacterium]
MDASLNVTLEAYQGPLDLLLDLIRKQEIDIYDIPVATITAQYLECIQHAQEQNIDVAGEFIYMAATLIYIKSKMLLPKDPDLPAELQEDPRVELVNQLLEHEKFRNAAQMLHEKQMLEAAAWSNPALQEFVDDSGEPGLAVGLYDLVKTFQEVLERARTRPRLDIEPEEVTTVQMIERVRDRLAECRGGLPLGELFAIYADNRRNLITLFLVILEMVRLQAIVLRQKEMFGEIFLRKHRGFNLLYSGPLEQLVRETSGAGESDEEASEPNAPAADS